MERFRFVITLGCAVFAFWVLYYYFLLSDLYLTDRSADFFLKTIMPFAFLIDIAGFIVGIKMFLQDKLRGSLVTAIYGLPLISALIFFWWLFFGVKI